MIQDRNKFKPYLIGAIVLICAFVTFIATRGDIAVTGVGSVRGLALMKEMAGKSVPYEVAMESDRPTLIEFYANWCTTCQFMAPVIDELHPKYSQAIDFVMLDIDDPQWMSVQKNYGVTGVPHFTFLDRNRQVTRTEIGRVPKNIFDRLLGELSS